MTVRPRYIPALFVSLLLVACGGQPRAVVYATDTLPGAYFPPSAHSPEAQADSFLALWYTRALVAMHEPPLYGAQAPPGVVVWRFIWLRSFDPPVAIRITNSPRRCSIVATALGNVITPEPPQDSSGAVYITDILRFGPITRRDSSLRSPVECTHAIQSIPGFWAAPGEDSRTGIDGANWVFEALEQGRYHVVTRWSPDSARNPRYRAAGLAFLALGGIYPTGRSLY
jgi:hypothetical protein